MNQIHNRGLLFVLSLSAAAALVDAGCAATNQPSDPGNQGPDDPSLYPAIDPSARRFEPGPVLATPDDVARKERLAYHQNVIALHKFSYTVTETGPSHRELANITGYTRSNKVPHHAGKKHARVKTPAKMDWRNQGVPEIRDQGNCGSCWAFGTTAVVESAIGIFGKTNVHLSEQYVVDCNQNQYGCNGGEWAYEMYSKPNGGVLESAYPYQASDGSCYGDKVAHPYLIDSFVHNDNPTVDDMKSAIFQYGAVGVSMAVCGSFPGYTSGVYDSPECNGSQSNHIVALVGWDDTMPHSQGKGVWILRNSWGTSWGDNGYAYVANGMANLEAEVTYVSYNGSSGSGSGSSGATTGSGAGGGGTGTGTGAGGAGGGTGTGGGGGGGTCGHDPCTVGDTLQSSCDPCVGWLCLADSYCCDTTWDDVCVQEAGWFCKQCP